MSNIIDLRKANKEVCLIVHSGQGLWFTVPPKVHPGANAVQIRAHNARHKSNPREVDNIKFDIPWTICLRHCPIYPKLSTCRRKIIWFTSPKSSIRKLIKITWGQFPTKGTIASNQYSTKGTENSWNGMTSRGTCEYVFDFRKGIFEYCRSDVFMNPLCS